MLADPRRLTLPPEEAAIVELATLVNETPWRVSASDFDRARGARLSDDAIVHVVVQTAFFNHLNRVADGVGIDFDYVSALPSMARENHEPIPRPERADWPTIDSDTPSFSLARRPATNEAFERWRAHNLERHAPLSSRDRQVIVLAVANALCDAATASEVVDAIPHDRREARLADYATALTLAPWRLADATLDPLRQEGLDDAGLLDVIAVGAFQNTASRLRLAFAAS